MQRAAINLLLATKKRSNNPPGYGRDHIVFLSPVYRGFYIWPLQMNAEITNTSFGRPEKLKSRKLIQKLFSGGRGIFIHPVKLVWCINQDEHKNRGDQRILAGVSVSKKNFKRAVDRNRIKRMLRECYRLNKTELAISFESKSTSIAFFLIYIDKSLPTFDKLQEQVIAVLNILRDKTRHLP